MTTSRRPALRVLASGAALAGVVTLTGCGGDASTAPSDPPIPSATASASDAALVRAVKLVLDAVPGSTLLSVANGSRGWTVQVADDDGTTSRAVVDAAGTSILARPAAQDDDREDQSDHARLVAGATVDYAVASRIIGKRLPGSITRLSLDEDDGQVVWEGASRPTAAVRVNAGDGRVLTPATESPDSDG